MCHAAKYYAAMYGVASLCSDINFVALKNL